MNIAILTTFPSMFSPLQESILGRAQKNGALSIETINIRDFSQNKHKNTDDYPYGGGCGMLMMPQPIMDAVDFAQAKGYTGKKIFLGPRGKTLTHSLAKELAKESSLILLCGHYEGVDQRALDDMDMEISIGDYILTGGELAAMVLIDAVARFVPNVLGSSESTQSESFSSHLLEYPQYTRPSVFRGKAVPEVLLNGNHAEIEKWRHEQSLLATFLHRPDLLEHANLSPKDQLYIESIKTHERS